MFKNAPKNVSADKYEPTQISGRLSKNKKCTFLADPTAENVKNLHFFPWNYPPMITSNLEGDLRRAFKA